MSFAVRSFDDGLRTTGLFPISAIGLRVFQSNVGKLCMLGLATNHGAPTHLRDFVAEELEERRIVTGSHCFGCTAGAGSSCRGAIS
jgi:hypothetical protein